MRQGKVGDRFYEGEVVLTITGKETTPFPKLTLDSNRKTINTLKRVDKWLLENTQKEAHSRNDEFNSTTFDRMNSTKLSMSDKDTLEYYLFGEDQPVVLKPFLKSLF